MRSEQAAAAKGPALWAAALIVAVVAICLGAWDGGGDRYGVNSDEWVYHESSRLQARFVESIWREGLAFITPETVEEHFRWNPTTVIHPTFSRLLSALSWRLLFGTGVMGEIPALRFHNALCLGISSALILAVLVRRAGWTAAVAGVLLHLGTVRYLGHVHVAQTDVVLATVWLACVISYGRSERAGWTVATGVLLGFALSTKYTALLLFPVLYGLELLRPSRRGLLRIATTAVVAAAVFYLLNPLFWWHPLHEAQLAMSELLARRETVVIPSLVLGKQYEFDVPWFTAPLSLLATTPLPLLVFGLAGASRAVWRFLASLVRGERTAAWPGLEVRAAAAGFAPVFVMTLPGSMAHDVERLFLPLFPLLALLAGSAVGWTEKSLRRFSRLGSAAAAGMVTALLLFVCASANYEWLRWHPFESVYFNPAVGGLPGALDRGFETFYMKNEVTFEVLDDLNRLLPPGARLGADYVFKELRQWQRAGRLRDDIKLLWGQRGDYFLVYWRHGWIVPWESALQLSHRPVYQRAVRGVPCLSLYALRPGDQAPGDDHSLPVPP